MKSSLRINKSTISETNGTFGEVLQGFLPNRKYFLVTLPIKIKSQAIFLPDESVNHIKVYPGQKKKVAKAISLLKKYYNLSLGGTLIVNSQIPEGKGMASSSADIVSSLEAIIKFSKANNSMNTGIDTIEIIEDIIKLVEPTDGVMYNECVFYYHREVKIGKKFGELPDMLILAVDEGGQVDTITHNKSEDIFSHDLSIEYMKLLSDLEYAIKDKNLSAIGKISTRSAVLNQKNLNKNFLSEFLKYNEFESVEGVVIAHSGTMIGAIINPNSCSVSKDVQHIMSSLLMNNLNPKIFSNL